MAYVYIRTEDRGDGTIDLVRSLRDGSQRAVIRSDVGQHLQIGPSFGAELRAAGLGDAVGWSNDGVRVDTDVVTPGGLQTLLTLLRDHDPTAPRPPSTFDTLIAHAKTLRADPDNITRADAKQLLTLLRSVLSEIDES
jgi:hypothetical protein